MLTDALFEVGGSNRSWNIGLPEYAAPGPLAGIDFAIAGTSLPLEFHMPLLWINGITKRIEPHTNYYLKELKVKTIIIHTF